MTPEYKYDTVLQIQLSEHKEVIEFYEISNKLFSDFNLYIDSVSGAVIFEDGNSNLYSQEFHSYAEMSLLMRKPNAIDHNISIHGTHRINKGQKTQISVEWKQNREGEHTYEKEVLGRSTTDQMLLKMTETLEKRWKAIHPTKAKPQERKPQQHKPTTTLRELNEEQNHSLYINKRKGTKTDFIRIVNVLWELDFFVTEHQNRLTKAEVFRALGRIIGDDLSTHEQILSRSMSDNTSLEKHLNIFDTMKNKMRTIFNRK